MRFFNQFDPFLLYFVEKRFFIDKNGDLLPDSTPYNLVRLVRAYAFNNQQDDMKWLHVDFFRKLIKTIAHKEILHKLDNM